MEFDVNVIVTYWPIIARGLAVTVGIFLGSLVLSFVLGLLIAIARLSRLSLLSRAAYVYIEFVRNLPFMILLFLFFFGLPAFGLHLPSFVIGVIALTVYGGAYYAEIFRAAIQSVPKGQTDSARATGMTHGQALRHIILPQMMGFFIPPATNQAVMLIKESAILSTITVVDLTMAAQIVQGYTYSPVEVFFMISVLYWILIAGVARVGLWLERVTRPGASGRQLKESVPSTAARNRRPLIGNR
ncbi:MAG TPA: amino acid ABC transporter permease [Hyphomicrobiaceae bacterium]|nr:amino acid ABC transporter permease [Hyphomicrobiaceae bacterium]